MKVAAIFYYPLLFYPLLLCNTLQRKVGYVFGTLLSFTHLVVLLWQKVDCPRTPEVRRSIVHVATRRRPFTVFLLPTTLRVSDL